ncbi:MAG: hypothetical protein Q7J55_02335 [bacterium]|nr:hypothetical protein [bacterium]
MRRILMMFFVLCLTESIAHGWIYREFSDLDSLIKYSDNVVIAKAYICNKKVLMDGISEYDFIFLHHIKGSAELKRTPVLLQTMFIRNYHDLREGRVAVLFLNRGDWEGIHYMSAGNSGAILPASPDLEIEKLKGLSPKEQISLILRDCIEYKTKQLEELKEDIAKIK